jgi:hypothetical protein
MRAVLRRSKPVSCPHKTAGYTLARAGLRSRRTNL